MVTFELLLNISLDENSVISSKILMSLEDTFWAIYFFFIYLFLFSTENELRQRRFANQKLDAHFSILVRHQKAIYYNLFAHV